MESCLNCRSKLNNNEKFCPNCGQKQIGEFNLKLLFNETISNYFSVDSSFIRSLSPLMFKPGFLPKAYISGQRTLYIHPAKIYLFVTFLFFFLFNFIDSPFKSSNSSPSSDIVYQTDTVDIKSNTDIISMVSNNSEINKGEVNTETYVIEPANDWKNKLNKKTEYYNKTSWRGFMQNYLAHLPLTIFLSLPLFAFILWLLFFKWKKRFSEYLTFSLYYFAFCFITIIIFVLMKKTVFPVEIWLTYLLALNFGYLIFALKSFNSLSWINAISKGLIQSVIFILVLLPASIIGLFLLLLW